MSDFAVIIRGYVQTERGPYRVGETHHNATVSDAMVARLRDLHERNGLGWRRLARLFNLPPYTVKDWLTYKRRAAVPTVHKRIIVRLSEGTGCAGQEASCTIQSTENQPASWHNNS